jgi:hypothetical protein
MLPLRCRCQSNSTLDSRLSTLDSQATNSRKINRVCKSKLYVHEMEGAENKQFLGNQSTEIFA